MGRSAGAATGHVAACPLVLLLVVLLVLLLVVLLLLLVVVIAGSVVCANAVAAAAGRLVVVFAGVAVGVVGGRNRDKRRNFKADSGNSSGLD